MAREVIFAPEAREDIRQIYRYIAKQAGAARAERFTDRVISYCVGFAMFPERGTRRDDLRLGLRITGLAGRVTIAFHVTPDAVIIDRVLYGGRDLKAALDNR